MSHSRTRFGAFARAALLVVALVGTLASTTIAQIIDYNGNAASHRGDGPYTVGNLFTVGGDSILITHLGAQDDSATGPTTNGFVAGSINVGLWDATGTTLLASASVPKTGSLFGTYRYAPIAGPAITLSAGSQYLIGAAVGSGLEFFEDSGAGAAPFVGNGVTLDASRFNAGGALTAPLSAGGIPTGRWGPANAAALSVTLGPEQPLFSVIDGPAGNRNDFTGTVGSEFTVGAKDIRVMSLGFEDAGQNGLASTHQVGIWDNAGALLGSVTVQAGTASTLEGDWRYEDLASALTLLAGQTYRIGGQTFSGGDAFTDTDAGGGGGPAIDFAVSSTDLAFSGNRFLAGSFGNPSSNGAGTPLRWAPGNLQFSVIDVSALAVPEPAGVAIWSLLGMLSVGYLTWRRKSAR